MSSSMRGGMIAELFREEAWAQLGVIRAGLENLGRPAVDDGEIMVEAQQKLHGLKGAAGVIGLPRASRAAHELESLISEAVALNRSGPSSWTGASEPLKTRMMASFGELAEACGFTCEPGPASRGSAQARQVRVPLAELDELGRLALELAARARWDESSTAGRLCAEIKMAIEKARFTSFASIEERLRLTVSAAAQQLGKQASLVLEGGATEICRGLLEDLTAPMEHLLRNAVDHGIEEQAVRVAAGKPIAGQIRIRTQAIATQLLIEVSDDGCGMDPVRIRRSAVGSGRLPVEESRNLSDQETLNLAFSAGVSTASDLTLLSGRGIGLAVVKDLLRLLGGTHSIESRPCQGTTIRMHLPLDHIQLPVGNGRGAAGCFETASSQIWAASGVFGEAGYRDNKAS